MTRPLALAEPEPTDGPTAVAACCSAVYGHPLAEALVGESFHPGGVGRTRELLAASGLPPRSRILDVGCGLGASARVAATEFELAVDAMDVSAAVLEGAQERSSGIDITWHQGNVAHLAAADETYDAVLAECVLAAAPRDQAVAEIVRVLRPGGLLLISDVEVSGDLIAGFERDGVLGTALCVASAWLPDELDERLEGSDLKLTRRWDHSGDILRLADRIEGRLAVARSLLPREPVPDELAGIPGVPDREEVRAITESVRAAVGDGRLGYFAAIAQRQPQHGSANG